MVTAKELNKDNERLIKEMTNKQFEILINKKHEDFLTNLYIYHDTDKADKINNELQKILKMATVEQNSHINGIKLINNDTTGFNPQNNLVILNTQKFLHKYAKVTALVEKANLLSIHIMITIRLMEELISSHFTLVLALNKVKDKELTKELLTIDVLQKNKIRLMKEINRSIEFFEEFKKDKADIYNFVDKSVLEMFKEVKKTYNKFIIEDNLYEI